MSTGYFDNFPSILYANLNNPNAVAQGDFKQVVNIFTRVAMLQSVLNNISAFYTYPVQDSDTPDIIAQKLYGDSTLYWLVLFANQILDPYFEWPLTPTEINTNLVATYGSVANAMNTIDHYEKYTNVTTTINYQQVTNTYVSILSTDIVEIDGSTVLPTINNPIIQVGSNNVVNFSDGSQVDTSTQLACISAYQAAIDENEATRTIQLVRPEYAQTIAKEFQSLLQP